MNKQDLIKNSRAKNIVTCRFASGNGANLYYCTKKKINCPYQMWCVNKRLYEFQGDSNKCSDFSSR